MTAQEPAFHSLRRWLPQGPELGLKKYCHLVAVSGNYNLKISASRIKSLSLFYSLWPRGLQPTRLLCPWNSPVKNTGVGSHSLLPGVFPTQRSNLGLLHCRQILYHLSQRQLENQCWRTVSIHMALGALSEPHAWEIAWRRWELENPNQMTFKSQFHINFSILKK